MDACTRSHGDGKSDGEEEDDDDDEEEEEEEDDNDNDDVLSVVDVHSCRG